MKFLSSLGEKKFSNETVILRVDLNVQSADLRENKIPLRIRAILPTIKFLTKRGAKVVILSHRGRPDKISDRRRIKNYTLKPFAKIISKLLGKPVFFIADFTKSNVADIVGNSNPESVFLFENLRFWSEEAKNTLKFAEKLASFGSFYVNDAFGVSHRKNASICQITRFLPSYAGLLLEKELKNLSFILKQPKKPLIVILGGAKISDKIGIIKNFYKKADYFLLGGGLANTIFAAQNLPMGDSLYEKNLDAGAIIKRFGKKIILPVDLIVEKRKVLDIGPASAEKYKKIIGGAKTIVFNGPMGYIENPKFAGATKKIVEAIIGNKKAFAAIGGGETTALFGKINFKPRILNPKLFLSTGGGAMLEYLAGKKLPGLQALNQKHQFK